MLWLILFSVFIVSSFGRVEEDTRSVKLEGLGSVQGKKYWDGEFYEFYGVPYATVPKGRDKFKSPLPPSPWEEEMKANRDIMCEQVYLTSNEDDDSVLYGGEECLVINLMVPKIASKTTQVPVIVYIHSGAFAGGSGNMAKVYHLARQDVMVVTLNYRLGAIGFACLGTEDIPGNAALKDIVAALKWIKKHVKSFGGDPDNITLAGFSVGATLAELVALSKESEGLFNKLVLDSGSALAPFAINRDPIATARNLAIAIGYEDTGNIEDLTEFLLDADTTDLQSVSRNFFLKNSTFGFAPCIEKPTNPGAVITESPLETLKKGNYGKFGLLTGFANMEGISRTSHLDKWSGLMNENFADFLPADLAFENEKERDAFIKELKQYYFNDKEVSNANLQGYIDYYSDSMFKYSILKSTKMHAKNMKRPIYQYEFSYVGKLNTKHYYMDTIRGASHRDASAYVLDFFDWTRNYTDLDMRDLMTTMWADYLKFENPTAYESALLNIKWEKYTNEDPNYLDIGDKLVMKKGVVAMSFKLWDKVYSKHYWTPTPPNPASYKEKYPPPKIAPRVQAKKHEDNPKSATKVDEQKPAATPQESKPVTVTIDSDATDKKPTNPPGSNAPKSTTKVDEQKPAATLQKSKPVTVTIDSDATDKKPTNPPGSNAKTETKLNQDSNGKNAQPKPSADKPEGKPMKEEMKRSK